MKNQPHSSAATMEQELQEARLRISALDAQLKQERRQRLDAEAEQQQLQSKVTHLKHLLAAERRWQESLTDNLARNFPGTVFELLETASGKMTIPFSNGHTREMFDLDSSQARRDASALFDRIHRKDQLKVNEAFRQSKQDCAPLVVEYRVVLPKVGLRHYLTRADTEILADGATLWRGCTMDVTEMKLSQLALGVLNEHLEERVEERTRELAAARDALASFSYSVSHDLQAPLAAIGGFAGYFAEAVERGDAERARHLSARIRANVSKMSTLIEAFLALAQSRKVPTGEDCPVAMGSLVQEILAESDPGEAGQVRVGELPTVKCQPAMMRQVWSNLLSNAIKYSRGREVPSIEIGTREHPGGRAFFVRDNGVGFDPAYAAKLFSPFARLHDGHAYPGTGIGLAIVHAVVERHGGTVWAESQPGEGACFWFSLPASRLREACGTPTESPA